MCVHVWKKKKKNLHQIDCIRLILIKIVSTVCPKNTIQILSTQKLKKKFLSICWKIITRLRCLCVQMTDTHPSPSFSILPPSFSSFHMPALLRFSNRVQLLASLFWPKQKINRNWITNLIQSKGRCWPGLVIPNFNYDDNWKKWLSLDYVTHMLIFNRKPLSEIDFLVIVGVIRSPFSTSLNKRRKKIWTQIKARDGGGR